VVARVFSIAGVAVAMAMVPSPSAEAVWAVLMQLYAQHLAVVPEPASPAQAKPVKLGVAERTGLEMLAAEAVAVVAIVAVATAAGLRHASAGG
jgi:hypothetical protein